MNAGAISIVLGAATALCAGTAFSASTLKVNFGGDSSETKVATEADAKGSADIVKVKARGVGANKDEALKDAYRDAVERAIGLYVDAEQMVKNDEVVQDQVLTHSNAYITHYEEVDTKPLSGGLVQVKIVADVKKGQLTKKLEGVMPPQTVKVNGGILSDAYAQIVSKEKRAGDSAALLKAALKDLDPVKSLIVAGVRADSQKLLTGDQAKIDYKPLPADKVMLRYLFELKLDREKYFKEFVPHLKKTLEQISLTKPKEVRISELEVPAEMKNSASEFFAGGWKRPHSHGTSLPYFINRLGFHGQERMLWPVHSYVYSLSGQNYIWEYGGFVKFGSRAGSFSYAAIRVNSAEYDRNCRHDKIQVSLVSQLNDNGSMGKISLFELDGALVQQISEWLCLYGGHVDSDYDLRKKLRLEDEKKTTYSIIFADREGNELAVYPWEVRNLCLVNARGGELPGTAALYITPFVGCFGENYLEWKSFVLDRELLKKIDTIKIELAE